ncbi:MAG: hypothetical protein ACN0LA_15550 [Candidatus Longimicrobiales bacterium M2_2A_002]
MTRRAGAVLALVAVALAAGLVGASRREAAREAERDAAVEASRIRSWARANASVGVSVLPKRVPAADPGELEAVEGLPGFHDFAMRCGSCHELPDPATYGPKRWIGKVAEMQEHIRRSGVMPPSEARMEAVTRFLGAASDSLR